MEPIHLTPVSIHAVTLKALSIGLAVGSLRYDDEMLLVDDEENVLANDEGRELTT